MLRSHQRPPEEALNASARRTRHSGGIQGFVQRASVGFLQVYSLTAGVHTYRNLVETLPNM